MPPAVVPVLIRVIPAWARVTAWLLAAALLAGSLVAYDPRTTLFASVAGAVIVAGVARPLIGWIATVAAALLLSSLPWAMTLAVQHGEPDFTLPALSLIPVALALLLLPVGAGHARHALLTVPAFVTVATAIIWLAFGTTYGHFWLNENRLDTLAAALASTPAIRSLSLGTDDRGERGNEFDSYRFVNDVLVTHYPGQARPGQQQPMIYIDDELRALGVPRERYDAMRRLMTRTKIGFVSRDPANGHVYMHRVGFDNEYDLFLLHVPADGHPGRELADFGSPNRHWFWVRRY